MVIDYALHWQCKCSSRVCVGLSPDKLQCVCWWWWKNMSLSATLWLNDVFFFLRLAISSVITYDILYYNYILQLTQTNWLTLKSLDITREVLHTSSHSCSSNETPKSHSQTHLRAVIVYSLHIPKAFHNILMLHVLHQKLRESCVTFLLIFSQYIV